MTRVTWGEPGVKIFQTGVDRGMFYTGFGIAVPWNGLSSVAESPTGGTPQDYYVDGQKILTVSIGEEFAGTITAFSIPDEFAPCAGRLELSGSLFVSDQPRPSFNFSYRTLLGNDLDGLAYGYKVHLVYNALASISDFAHVTNSDAPGLTAYSLAFTTTSEAVDGYRPTSHFVVDSISLDPAILAQLEAILYGDSSNDPSWPAVSDLMTLITS